LYQAQKLLIDTFCREFFLETDELFGDEWFDFSEQPSKDDFWGEVFEEGLLTLR